MLGAVVWAMCVLIQQVSLVSNHLPPTAVGLIAREQSKSGRGQMGAAVDQICASCVRAALSAASHTQRR
jgi:hypothetical protein